MTQIQKPFNPSEHVMQLKSKDGMKDYLPVQWRLVWFREKFPQGQIETEEIFCDPTMEITKEVFVWNNEKRRSEKVLKTAQGYARYKATVRDGIGGVATGHKTECAVDFDDYAEKAETGATGRALAALGYGTQFAPELNEEHRIVDSPVDRAYVDADETDATHDKANGNHRANAPTRPQEARSAVQGAKPALSVVHNGVTPEQLNALYDAGRDKGVWTSANGMYDYASRKLHLAAMNKAMLAAITSAQYDALMQAVDSEPHTAAS